MRRTHRWTIALVLVLTAPALAGCIGSDASPGAASPANTDGGASHDVSGTWDAEDGAGIADARAVDDTAGDGASDVPSGMTFEGCDVQVGVFEIPAALAAERIPEGFEPASVVQPAAPTASFVVDAHNCDKATSDAFETPVKDVGWVSYFLAVDPPDKYEDESVDFYFVPISAVAGSPEVADTFEAWDVAVEEGTVDLSATATPAGRTGQLEVRSETVSSMLYTVVSSEAAEGDPDHRARWFQVSDGEVTSIVQPNVSASGSFMGGAERVSKAVPSDPGQAPLWAAENPATRGVGAHFIAELIDVQHLDPAEVASS